VLQSLIRLEARGLHPLGALACTHMSQAEGDLSSIASIRTRERARQQNPLRESLIHLEARGLTPSGCARAYPHEPSRKITHPNHVSPDARLGMHLARRERRCPSKTKPLHGSQKPRRSSGATDRGEHHGSPKVRSLGS
jgi:hypothetical protein